MQNKGAPQVLDFFIHGKGDYPLSSVITTTRLSYRTANSIINQLERTGILRLTRTFGRSKFYCLNQDSPAARHLAQLPLYHLK